MVHALAQGSGYKALVCVFLAGGNDGNNLVVPADTTGYAAYSAVRSVSGLAIAQGSLLPVCSQKHRDTNSACIRASRRFIHFLNRKSAVVCNVKAPW
jgi:uncharacterized protein (DUF1501 family)